MSRKMLTDHKHTQYITRPASLPSILKLSGSRSLWWNDSARTKPASTETLNISRSREAVIARENVASHV